MHTSVCKVVSSFLNHCSCIWAGTVGLEWFDSLDSCWLVSKHPLHIWSRPAPFHSPPPYPTANLSDRPLISPKIFSTVLPPCTCRLLSASWFCWSECKPTPTPPLLVLSDCRPRSKPATWEKWKIHNYQMLPDSLIFYFIIIISFQKKSRCD